jgi:hypothetical protein
MNSPIKSLDALRRYKLVCTLSFGDVYSQIMVWLLVIFLSLATAMGLMGASRPVFALGVVGLILVLSLPFLLFAFVSTLLNHIEIREVEAKPQPQSITEPVVMSRMESAVGT